MIGVILLVYVTSLKAQRAEAENGYLEGTTVASSRAGFSGSGYVTGFEEDGDAVTMTVEVSHSQVYTLSFGYAAPFGYKENDVFINDVYAGSQQFAASSAFTEATFGNVFLEQGQNKIKVVKNWGYFELDYVMVTPAQRNDYNQVVQTLVNEQATTEAQVLYQYLKDHYGHKIISGQQADAGGDAEFDYIETHTGKIPAIKGFDLIDYSPSRAERGTNSVETEKAIEWWEKGGIVSLMWHWNAPKDLIDEPGKEWWRGFYTDATTFDLTVARDDPQSEAYELIIRDIDIIAEELKEIANANAPVLWRPLHEAEGGWFWWGAKGPEACVWLWKLMYDRLTTHHALNNLIWVWTGTDSNSALEWYPGDNYVDIIGADIYLENGNYSTNFTMFDNMVGIHEGTKVITLSETGTIPDPDELDKQRARWSWFCVWSGDFIRDGIKNDIAHLNSVYNHEYVITFDELPDFYNYQSPDFPDEEDLLAADRRLGLTIYPNPTSGAIKITLPQSFASPRVFLYDLQGRLLLTHQETGTEPIELDLSAYPRGMYMIKVVSGVSSQTFRVGKQ